MAESGQAISLSSLKAEDQRADPTAKESDEDVQIKAEDDAILLKMGYKQELFRGFNSLMAFTFCFTAVNVVSSISLSYAYALNTGGWSTLVWSWVIASVCSIIVGCSMAEICSTYPSAGSVYHWTGQLVPPERAPLISYICGWFNFMGNAAGDASFAYGFAQAVATAAVWTSDTAEPWTVGQQVALAISLCLVVSLLNALRVDQQGWINNFATFWHIATTIVVIFALLTVTSSRADASTVFTGIYNGTGFESMTYVYFIGMLSSCFSFSGYEAGAHMAEETVNATRSSPWGVVMTCVTSAIVGFVYIMALLFATPDIEWILAVTDGSPYGDANTAIDVFIDACGRQGGLALAAILIVLMFFATFSSLTVTSRIGFAMCRDRAFPLSDYLSHVDQRTQTPLRAVGLCFMMDALFLLLPLVNYHEAVPIAFFAVTGITTIGYQVSYGIPILMRLTYAKDTFHRSRFDLGKLSIPMGIISVTWLFGTSLLMFLPASSPTTKENMNYSCVVVGGFAFIATVNWFVSARFHYRGPQRGKNDVAPPTSPSSSSGGVLSDN